MTPAFVSLRLGFLYAAFFAFVGVALPFWPLWLEAKGLTAEQIGLVLAVAIGAKVVSNPIVAQIADARAERRRPMIVLAAASLAAFAGLGGVDGFWAIFAVYVLFNSLWPPIMPLAESLTMMAAERGRVDYGRVRLWGSIAFVVVSAAAGRALVGAPPSLVYWMIVATLVVALAASIAVPDLRPERRPQARWPMLGILRQPGFAPFVLACALIQGSHAVYYAFGTIHWRAAGYGEDLIGALWAEGVIAEIVLFAVGARVIGRLGPQRLVALAGAAAALRWAVTGLTDALPALVAVQALHAFSFGAAHLGAIHFIARAVQPSMSATAQSLYAALAMGLGMGLSLYAAGVLYAEIAGLAYLAMAAMAAAGGSLAAVAVWPRGSANDP